MERTYRPSNAVYLYAALLALDTVVLAWEGLRRLRSGEPLAGGVLVVLGIICAVAAAALFWRCGRTRVVITRDALVVRGESPPRRVYWADVDRVREFHGPAYQLALQHLFTGPYLPHGLMRGETILELTARPGGRLLIRRALIDGYEALRQDVLRSISKHAEVDLHARWWRA